MEVKTHKRLMASKHRESAAAAPCWALPGQGAQNMDVKWGIWKSVMDTSKMLKKRKLLCKMGCGGRVSMTTMSLISQVNPMFAPIHIDLSCHGHHVSYKMSMAALSEDNPKKPFVCCMRSGAESVSNSPVGGSAQMDTDLRAFSFWL